MDQPEQVVRRLLKVAGTAYAADAGIRINDKPMPLMISAFGRAHYVRCDESSATRLTDIAEGVRDEYSGDLRELARSSQQDVAEASRKLKQFKDIGDIGADIFLREVQDVWTWVRPPRRSGEVGSACAAGQCAPGRRARQDVTRRRRAPAGGRLTSR
jgi:hypothetical protein